MDFVGIEIRRIIRTCPKNINLPLKTMRLNVVSDNLEIFALFPLFHKNDRCIFHHGS
jgi:hypothetical protein